MEGGGSLVKVDSLCAAAVLLWARRGQRGRDARTDVKRVGKVCLKVSGLLKVVRKNEVARRARGATLLLISKWVPDRRDLSQAERAFLPLRKDCEDISRAGQGTSLYS